VGPRLCAGGLDSDHARGQTEQFGDHCSSVSRDQTSGKRLALRVFTKEVRMTNDSTGRVEFLVPDGLIRNPAFSHVAVVSGPTKTIYIGGQDSVTGDGQIVGKGNLAAQTKQILTNMKTALAAAGAGPEHVIKWNLYILAGQDIRAGFEAFQEVWGKQPNPPLVTAAFVSALANPDFLVEIDAIAVVPL
jgi:enamine deaminase RidA (YjgF/YER057c/UK114 family)